MGGRELGDCADCDSDKTVRGGGWGEVKGFDIGAEEREEKRESIFSAVSPSSPPDSRVCTRARNSSRRPLYFQAMKTALFSLPFSFFFVHLNSVALELQEKRRVVLYAQR